MGFAPKYPRRADAFQADDVAEASIDLRGLLASDCQRWRQQRPYQPVVLEGLHGCQDHDSDKK